MPELPEVETVVSSLRPVLVNSKISNLTVLKVKIVSPDLSSQITNQKILAVERLGKYIIIQLTVGYLVVHLRMTGKLFTVNLAEFELAKQTYKHLHVIFDLISDPSSPNFYQNSQDFQTVGPIQDFQTVGPIQDFQTVGPIQDSQSARPERSRGMLRGKQVDNFLLFVDQRQFGKIIFCEDLAWLHEKLGVDPFDTKFTVDWLRNKFSQIKRAAKSVLLDQSIIAGLGNIYVDEALWYARVHPKRPVNQISLSELQKLHLGIKATLELAIAKNGTTFQSYSFMGEKTGECAAAEGETEWKKKLS